MANSDRGAGVSGGVWPSSHETVTATGVRCQGEPPDEGWEAKTHTLLLIVDERRWLAVCLTFIKQTRPPLGVRMRNLTLARTVTAVTRRQIALIGRIGLAQNLIHPPARNVWAITLRLR